MTRCFSPARLLKGALDASNLCCLSAPGTAWRPSKKGRKIDADKRMAVEGIHAFKRSVCKLARQWRQFADPSDDVTLKWDVVDS